MSGRPPAVAKAARPPSTRWGRDPHPWHALAPALGLWAPTVAQPRTAHSQAASFACASVSPRAALPWRGMPGWAGLPVGCRGHPGSGRPGRAPHPPRWQPARHKPVFIPPPRHSPGAGCAGCVEPGVPSPGPAPLCRHTGHPESPPARQRRACSCGDTRELHPEISETDTIPPERSLGSSDTCLPGFGCGRKCPNIPWSPALWRLLPWLSHGSQAPEVLLL